MELNDDSIFLNRLFISSVPEGAPMDGERSGAVDILVDPNRLIGVDVEPLHRVARVVGACNN